MSSSRTTSLIAAAATRHRVVVGWWGLDPGTLHILSANCGAVRSKSSRVRPSVYCENENNHEGSIARNRIIRQPAHRVNGIAKTKGILGGETPTKSRHPPNESSTRETTEVDDSAPTTSKATLMVVEEAEELRSSYASPSELSFAGDTPFPITSRLHIVTPQEDTPRGIWPIFRIMDEDGTFRDGSNDGYQPDGNAQTLERSSAGNDVNGSKSSVRNAEEHHDPSLSALRDSLCEMYPNHSSVIEQSGLFRPSKFEYADTNSRDTLKRVLRHMSRLREMDSIFQNAQRQGRVSFYLTCRGEEGIHFGAASALEPRDIILGQYREQGPLMWRGFTLQQFADQCFGNASDLGKGRQMPIHYGSRALNYQTISSCLGTQIPQAVGVALRLKMMAAADTSNSETKNAVSLAFFGDGCTSTTDFHSGLNFAATLKCPVIFFCRNNGYAISTSTREQFASDGIVSKAPGYGMAGIRVDGNDVFAVHAAVREARAYALEHNAPVLIEAMSYRQGHHSTSDDSLQYRSAEEVDHFASESDPLDRLQKFFKRHEYGEMTDDKLQSIVEDEKKAILDALRQAERKPKPPLEDLFTDVYHEMPASLKAQQLKLNEHISKYPDSYTL